MRLVIAGILTLVIFIMICFLDNRKIDTKNTNKQAITIGIHPYLTNISLSAGQTYPSETFVCFLPHKAKNHIYR